jgi:hypothetical protein
MTALNEIEDALKAFQRIETSLRSHLSATWHTDKNANEDLEIVRTALTQLAALRGEMEKKE